MTAPVSTTAMLQGMAEPTRLRILNCLAAAPLVVSDLQAILDLSQPTVSRHLRVLRNLGLVQDTPVARFVLYRLRRHEGPLGRLLRSALDSAVQDDDYRQEREAAVVRCRLQARAGVGGDLRGRTA